MDIKLPSQAEEYFNKKAEELFSLLQPSSLKGRGKPKTKLSNSHSVKYSLNSKDFINIRMTGAIDGFGRERSRYFQTQEGSIGLEGEKYSHFAQLVTELVERSELKDFLSEEFLKEILFRWLEKKYKEEFTEAFNCVDYLKKRAKEEIKTRKISTPISYLSIEKPFKIGNVTFEFYTKEFFDRFEKHIREDLNKRGSDSGSFVDKLRDDYQGTVFSSISIKGETRKCIEIAKEETEKALVGLRFFSPTAFIPEIPSYFGVMGKVFIPSSHVFIFENDFPNIQKKINETRYFIFKVREEDLQKFREYGLDHLNKLLIKENKTKLEKLLLNCLFLFSKAITAKDFQDTLVFTLVSIETLLLRSTSEPIQSTVGLRLSFLSGQNIKDRKYVKKLVNDAYRVRSAYLHHGKRKKDFTLLKNLQLHVWIALRNVLVTRDNYSSQEELLKYIEDLVLS